MPLPNMRVIPAGWSAHHRPVAEGAMTATGTITRPATTAPPTFDETLGYSTQPEPTTIYDGTLAVQRAISSESHAPSADREVTLREYYVKCPADVPAVAVNDVVTVRVCDDDTTLVGRRLRVREVRYGSLIWERILVCDDTTATTR